jgi:hypothetical protein
MAAAAWGASQTHGSCSQCVACGAVPVTGAPYVSHEVQYMPMAAAPHV